MLFKKFKGLLLLAVVFIFSMQVHADLVIIPTSDSYDNSTLIKEYISYFTNEIISVQGLDLERKYNDVVIHTDLLGSPAAEADEQGNVPQ